jgi:hypothetical protein
MSPTTDVQEREAKHGQKMIEVKLRFWTDEIAESEGNILPKHAWTSGVARMERNAAHGIVPQRPLVFHSLLDIGSVIEKALIEHGIELHVSRKMRKYVTG